MKSKVKTETQTAKPKMMYGPFGTTIAGSAKALNFRNRSSIKIGGLKDNHN